MEMLSSFSKALFDCGRRKRGEIADGSEPEHLEGEGEPGIDVGERGKRQIGEKGPFLPSLDDRDSFTANREGGKLGGNPVGGNTDPGADAGVLVHGSPNRTSGTQAIAPESLASFQIADGLPPLHWLDQWSKAPEDGADALPGGVIGREIGLEEEPIRALVVRLSEGHARPDATLQCSDIGLAHLTALGRTAAKNQWVRTEFRAAALFNSDPETRNHAKMKDHQPLAEATSFSLEHEF
jgi:hypothetical protein